MGNIRIRGRIKTLNPNFGHLIGEDKVERFFIPSGMRQLSDFDELRVGDLLEFVHIDHARGARAIDIVLIRYDIDVEEDQ